MCQIIRWLAFHAVTCFPGVWRRCGSELSACVSSFWIWAGLHGSERGRGERNAHPFPSSLLTCRFWLLPHGIGKGELLSSIPSPLLLHSLSLSWNLASHILKFYSIAPPCITTVVGMVTSETRAKLYCNLPPTLHPDRWWTSRFSPHLFVPWDLNTTFQTPMIILTVHLLLL